MTQTTDTEIRDLILDLDKKIDARDKKVEVSAVRTEERLKALEIRYQISINKGLRLVQNSKPILLIYRVQLRSQDNRLWTFIIALFLAVFGFAPKLILFPGSQA
jgi:hypothetical protein